VRLHDDTSTYTGVYAQGGPTTVDEDTSLNNLLDRSDADVRGVKTGAAAADVAAVTHAVAGVHLNVEESKGAARPASKKGKKKATSGAAGAAAASHSEPAGSLQEVFAKFAGGNEMDGKTFAKVCKDCKVINKKCTTTDIDLIFARNKERTQRKITFQQFIAALNECATKRGESMGDLEAAILSQGGPVFSGT